MAQFSFFYPYNDNNFENEIDVFSTILAQFVQQRTMKPYKNQQSSTKNF